LSFPFVMFCLYRNSILNEGFGFPYKEGIQRFEKSKYFCVSKISSRGKGFATTKNITTATIISIDQLNPLIKTFKLGVNSNAFSFKSGQWSNLIKFKDNNIHNMSKDNMITAGFSMLSSPEQLKYKREIEFAVKKTKHPITISLHDSAPVGASVFLDGGHGDFYYSSTRYPPDKPVLLIAGGIGITPLISILRHINEVSPTTKVTILHSTRHFQDALLQNHIQNIAERNHNIRALWAVTSPEDMKIENKENVIKGRITLDVLKQLQLDLTSVCFVCGPQQMVQDVRGLLVQLGMQNIQYERW